MLLKRIALPIAVLVAFAAASAGAESDSEWRLRIKKEGSGWTASLSGPQDYGPAGKRIKGSGVLVEKQRTVGAFSRLRLEGPIDVRLNQAGADAVKIAADDNIEPLIETRIDGDTLVLRLQPGAGFTTRHGPAVTIDSKSLQAVTLAGSGDLSLERFKGDSLSLSQSGSGDLRLGLLELRELSMSLSGSGDVQAAGRADVQHWTLNGSGDVDARSLSGRQVNAQLNGSGDLDLGVCESLEAQLRGSGDLRYAGRPQLRQQVTGSGEISRR